MARIIADRDIKRLMGSVLVDADERLLNPNGIELRLGQHVLFHSTGEEAELEPGQFLQVQPGESVAISSIECIDFSAESIARTLPNVMLMGLITPTTTMMREGMSQASPKINAGFRGILNWGFRNGSIKRIVLQYGEPIFKLTVIALDAGEQPERAYGQREEDAYQDATGRRLAGSPSTRRSRLVGRSSRAQGFRPAPSPDGMDTKEPATEVAGGL